MPIPERFLKIPELTEDIAFYYDAFIDLTHDRQMGFGEGPIPTMTIIAYGQYYELPKDQIEDLLYFVRGIDCFHLKRMHEKAEAKAKAKKK